MLPCLLRKITTTSSGIGRYCFVFAFLKGEASVVNNQVLQGSFRSLCGGVRIFQHNMSSKGGEDIETLRLFVKEQVSLPNVDQKFH